MSLLVVVGSPIFKRVFFSTALALSGLLLDADG